MSYEHLPPPPKAGEGYFMQRVCLDVYIPTIVSDAEGENIMVCATKYAQNNAVDMEMALKAIFGRGYFDGKDVVVRVAE